MTTQERFLLSTHSVTENAHTISPIVKSARPKVTPTSTKSDLKTTTRDVNEMTHGHTLYADPERMQRRVILPHYWSSSPEWLSEHKCLKIPEDDDQRIG